MNKFVILLGLCVGWANIAFAASPAPAGQPEAGESQVAVCSACHGPDGNSAAPFPKLAGQGEKYLYKQLVDIRDGARPIPTMVGLLDDKSDQDLADMAAFYAVQNRTGEQTAVDQLELGARVYRAGIAERNVAACIACHSPIGEGNAPAGYPALAGQHPQYIADQLRAYRKGYEDPEGRTNDGDLRIMRQTAFGLSDMEIEAVAGYAAGLRQ
ncbi:MAG: c-type cytochrome [Pseudomonadota bacterium]